MKYANSLNEDATRDLQGNWSRVPGLPVVATVVREEAAALAYGL